MLANTSYHFGDVMLGDQAHENFEIVIAEIVTQQVGFLKYGTSMRAPPKKYHMTIELQKHWHVKLD